MEYISFPIKWHERWDCCYWFVHFEVIARMKHDMAALVIRTETADLALHQRSCNLDWCDELSGRYTTIAQIILLKLPKVPFQSMYLWRSAGDTEGATASKASSKWLRLIGGTSPACTLRKSPVGRGKGATVRRGGRTTESAKGQRQTCRQAARQAGRQSNGESAGKKIEAERVERNWEQSGEYLVWSHFNLRRVQINMKKKDSIERIAGAALRIN